MLARLAILAAATVATTVKASQCVVFDSNWNLYALNVGGADYNLGTSTSWSGGKATTLPTTGRPPFTGNNTQCFLSEYENALYILDADASNPTDVYIYDATANSWTTQVTSGGVDPTTMVAILDHDTNVFFALSAGTLYQADFGALKAGNSTPIPWQSIEAPGFTTTNYSPVMALAQNHIHFLDVPGAPAGDAYIFVIHFAYFQPEPQTYTASSGGTFPSQHGATTTFFLENVWQEQFAYIPDDNSATYVFNVQTNTTIALAAPPTSNTGSSYAASIDSLVQLTSAGVLSYIPYDQDKPDTSATWATIKVSGLNAESSTSSGATSTGTATGSSTQTKIATTTLTGSQTKTSSGSSSTSSSTSSTGAAVRNRVTMGAGAGAAVMAVVALFLS